MKAHSCNEHSSVLEQGIHKREHILAQPISGNSAPDPIAETEPATEPKKPAKAKPAKKRKAKSETQPVTAPGSESAPSQPQS